MTDYSAPTATSWNTLNDCIPIPVFSVLIKSVTSDTTTADWMSTGAFSVEFVVFLFILAQSFPPTARSKTAFFLFSEAGWWSVDDSGAADGCTRDSLWALDLNTHTSSLPLANSPLAFSKVTIKLAVHCEICNKSLYDCGLTHVAPNQVPLPQPAVAFSSS